MRCPSCGAELETADRQGIEVLCCPRCAGIWLNAGALEKIIDRILDATAAVEDPAHGGPRHATPNSNQTKGRSLKMRLTCVLVLAVFGLMAATAFGDEPKSYRVELSAAKIGTAGIERGQYKMLVHRDGTDPMVRFTDVKTGNEIAVPGKVESGETKYPKTEVHTMQVNGVPQITEIRIGGTTLRVAFQQGS
jgi:Zn-finger nucleic acid-binding protein